MQPLVLEDQLDDADFETLLEEPAGSALLRALRPVGRLRATVRGPGGSVLTAVCTAVLVGPDVLLTARHCFPGRHGIEAIAGVFEATGAQTEGRSAGAPFAIDERPLAESLALDYALLRVSGRLGARVGWARLADRLAMDGDPLIAAHHPWGGELRITRRDCKVHRATEGDLVHTCDTAAGSSGAPLFSAADFTVAGLHIAGSRGANYGKQAVAVARDSGMNRLLGTLDVPPRRSLRTRADDEPHLAKLADAEVARGIRAVLEPLRASAGTPDKKDPPAALLPASQRRPLLIWEP